MATNGLHSMFEKIATKLSNLNKKLDYYLNVTSQCIDLTNSATVISNLSGVTIASKSIRLIGNDLNLFLRLSVSSAAQTTIGTGNITNKLLCTITLSNFVNTGASVTNETTNLNKISAFSEGIAASSGYSAGNACPASFYCSQSSSGSTLTIECYINALYAKTSEFRLSCDIPVTRVKSYYD